MLGLSCVGGRGFDEPHVQIVERPRCPSECEDERNNLAKRRGGTVGRPKRCGE